jgi:lipopolysaccharide/colanic/teichoic acid biosynthesis glycosyltransferase
MIKIEDGGPIFYNASRIGKNGLPFIMYKYRSMKMNAPDVRLKDGSTYNAKNDIRITKVGKIVREMSLDETPQLINILFGQMSFIGPRPDVNSSNRYPDEYKSILSVLPGITGYNQAHYRNESTWSGKMINDKYYVDHMSLLFDLKIILNTINIVLKKDKTYRR